MRNTLQPHGASRGLVMRCRSELPVQPYRYIVLSTRAKAAAAPGSRRWSCCQLCGCSAGSLRSPAASHKCYVQLGERTVSLGRTGLCSEWSTCVRDVFGTRLGKVRFYQWTESHPAAPDRQKAPCQRSRDASYISTREGDSSGWLASKPPVVVRPPCIKQTIRISPVARQRRMKATLQPHSL